jgi:hypothetical protein
MKQMKGSVYLLLEQILTKMGIRPKKSLISRVECQFPSTNEKMTADEIWCKTLLYLQTK